MIADIVTTKINANPIPMALLGFLEIPRKGQIPRNADKIMLETNKQLITIAIIPMSFSSYAFFAASACAFAFAAFLVSIFSLIATNAATQIPSTKKAPVG